MRADRLLAALLVLQARGKLTAAELAVELEVSIKTARRDLEALTVAGVPVYALPGRNGGWQLLDGARTDLTGLTEPEARALFFLLGPAARASPAAQAALRKLLQALPAPFREAAAAASASVVVDGAAWGGWLPRDPPALEPLRQAIVERRRVELTYVDRDGRRSTRVASPLGVVKKGQDWYLLADTDAGRRTFLVGRVQQVALTDMQAERSPDFDLEAEWQRAAEQINQLRRTVTARLRVQREQLEPLRYLFGEDLEVTGEHPDGGIDATIAGASATMLAHQLAGWGASIEVLGPPALRQELARIGRELVAKYA